MSLVSIHINDGGTSTMLLCSLVVNGEIESSLLHATYHLKVHEGKKTEIKDERESEEKERLSEKGERNIT